MICRYNVIYISILQILKIVLFFAIMNYHHTIDSENTSHYHLLWKCVFCFPSSNLNLHEISATSRPTTPGPQIDKIRLRHSTLVVFSPVSSLSPATKGEPRTHTCFLDLLYRASKLKWKWCKVCKSRKPDNQLVRRKGGMLVGFWVLLLLTSAIMISWSNLRLPSC